MNTQLDKAKLEAVPALGAGRIDPTTYAAAKEACRRHAELNPNASKTDLLLILIGISIGEGANTMPTIIGAVRSAAAFSEARIAVVAKTSAGTDPTRHLWRIEPDGTFSLN